MLQDTTVSNCPPSKGSLSAQPCRSSTFEGSLRRATSSISDAGVLSATFKEAGLGNNQNIAYTLTANVTATGFTITATPTAEDKADWPTLEITEAMQVTEK